jgi:nuclear pore complex protein Nup107
MAFVVAYVVVTQLLPTLVGPLPSVITLQPPPSDAEMLLVRSIEWTTFMTSTHETALEQANVILRYFLGRSRFYNLTTSLTLGQGAARVPIAKLVLTALPPELASIADPEERAIEYLHYRQFFNIWDVLDSVVECQALEVLPMSKDAHSTWLNDYKVCGLRGIHFVDLNGATGFDLASS